MLDMENSVSSAAETVSAAAEPASSAPEPVYSAAGEVVKIITAAVEAIAKQRGSKTDDSGRKTDLFFPEGIGDIHVSFKAAGGVDVDVTIASSPPKVERFEVIEPNRIRATAHPMFVHLVADTPIHVKFSLDDVTYGKSQPLQPGGQIVNPGL